MNKKILGLFLTVVLFLSFIPGALAAEKKKIAIADFSNGTSHPKIGIAVAETLTMELVKNKSYQVIERAKLQNILGEQHLTFSGVVDASTTSVKLGKIKGIDYLVTGSVIRADRSTSSVGIPILEMFGGNRTKTVVAIQVRLVDVSTGEIILAEEAEGNSSSGGVSLASMGSFQEWDSSAYGEATREAVKNFVKKLNEMNPLEGMIVKVDGKKIYIDLGFREGVEKDDKFIIFSEGDFIKHPVTGEILGVDRIERGVITADTVTQSMTICNLEKGRTTTLQPGDKIIRLY